MFLFGGAEKIENGSVTAIFDIASSSVGGLLLRKRNNRLPEILLSVRREIVFDRNSNFPAIWRVFLEAFAAIAKHLKSNFDGAPHAALCVFSSPWYISQTKLVKVRREKLFEIDEHLVARLVKEESDGFKKHWRNSVWAGKGDSVFFESELLKIMLNGYETESLFGKFARNIELYVYLSLGLDLIEESVNEEIRKHIKTDKIYFHTFPFAAFNVLREVLNTQEGFIFADIAGELTDIFLMRDGVIEEVNCFNKGENFLTRRLASAFNADFAEANAILRQYQRAELNSEKSQKAGDVLKSAGDEWGKSLKELLKNMSRDRLLPQNFYFCGESGSLSEITSQVSSGDISAFTILAKPFTVHFLQPGIFKDDFEFAKGFSNNKDIPLLLSSLFASKIVK